MTRGRRVGYLATRERAVKRWAAVLAPTCLLALAACGGSMPAVSVFPVPGSRMASPAAQIVFRGVAPRQIGHLTVTGSRSGVHSGRLEPDSDDRGGSFLPDRPFSPGEAVTVRTGVHVAPRGTRSFRFHVLRPAPAPPAMPAPRPARVAGDVEQFRSRPDLHPASVEILNPTPASETGDIFLGPQVGPLQEGPMIVDGRGTLVWFKPLPAGEQATDFRVQPYRGRPALTWWQGRLSAVGTGLSGEDVITDSAYRTQAVVRAGNGLSADLHEFQLTSRGTALITAYQPVLWDARPVGGAADEPVLDAVVQEIDIPTGLVLFQWDSLDHVPLGDSHVALPTVKGQPYDYFHVNSVKPVADGSLMVSARNTWAAYDVSRNTGRVLWQLGGKRSSFTLKPGAAFAFQHDVELAAGSPATVTLFDDGAGPPNVHKQSRGLRLRIDRAHRTASATAQQVHSPPLLAQFEGNVQRLPGGHVFLGWGGQAYFSEYDRSGHLVSDGRFVDANTSYRAYCFAWIGRPAEPPAVRAVAGAGGTSVYASWNGATGVSSWRVLGGAGPGSLRPVASAADTGFETTIAAPAERYVAVQALDARARVLATSPALAVG